MTKVMDTIPTDPSIYLEDSGWLCLDLETTSIEYGSALNQENRLLLASWYTPEKGMQTLHCDEFTAGPLLKAVSEAKFIIAHNLKFEMQWLARCGLDLHDILGYDTMLGEWVIAGNRMHIRRNLNATAERYGVGQKEDVVAQLIAVGVSTESIPPSWLQTYCEQDVALTVDIFRKQRLILKEREQLHLQLARCLLTPVLADMETMGVTLSKERVYEEYNSVAEERDRVETELGQLATELGAPAVNWGSRKQVAQLLYDTLKFPELTDRRGSVMRTASGQPLTDKSSIEALKPSTKEQRKFQKLYTRLAFLTARLSKSLNFFKVICDEYDSTFYGIFKQNSTATHRLSSSGRPITSAAGKDFSAQLQNLPREYKRLVKAKHEGWRVLEIDASQLEFRVAADLGRDKVALEEIATGVDIHTNTARVFLEAGTQPEFKGLTLEQARQPAKPQTFKPLYGGRGTTPAEKKYCEFFQKKYSGIYDTQSSWALSVLAKQELRTPYGMNFYWPGTRMNAYGGITNSTAIFNYPIQGLATAEIIPVVLVHVWHKLRHWNVRIVLTVHDSIVIEVAPDVDIDKLNEVLFECFTSDVYKFLKTCYNYVMECPLGAESKIGEHWGEGKGIKYTKSPQLGETS